MKVPRAPNFCFLAGVAGLAVSAAVSSPVVGTLVAWPPSVGGVSRALAGGMAGAGSDVVVAVVLAAGVGSAGVVGFCSMDCIQIGIDVFDDLMHSRFAYACCCYDTRF